jgi:hypothetical protein
MFSLEGWLRSRGIYPTEVGAESGEWIKDLQAGDVVLLGQLKEPLTAEEMTELSAWIRSGGGMLAVSGFLPEGEDRGVLQDSLTPLGISLGETLLSGPVVRMNRDHLACGLASLPFRGGYRVDAGRGVDATALAWLNTEPVGQAVILGEGRLVAWGDEWILLDPGLAEAREVKQLWDRIFSWLRGEEVPC